MSDGKKMGRRMFMGASLLGFGGFLGWFAGRFRNPRPSGKKLDPELVSRFEYDLSEFEKTDPSQLLYEPGEVFPTGFGRVGRLTTTPSDRILVGGDRSIKVFESNGDQAQEIPLDRQPHGLFASGDDEWIVSLRDRFEIYDGDGQLKVRTESLGPKVYITSMLLHEDKVYAADAGNRRVIICDRAGKITDQFGKKDPARNNPGFAVPSPYFELRMASDGKLRIANPGRLRVETYTLDGSFESSWGEPGMKIDRFCGCCNPVYFTMTPSGDFITSEKGLARINVYRPDGSFKGAVAGPDMLVEDEEMARKACVDCRIGAGFDVAVDTRGRVLAMDPYQRTIRFFTPKAVV